MKRSFFLAIKVPRRRFLPVKKTQDLLAIMSDLYEIADDFSLRLRSNRPIPHQPTIKLSSHFNMLAEFHCRFSSIPSLVDLTHMVVDGNVYFGSDITLKVSEI